MAVVGLLLWSDVASLCVSSLVKDCCSGGLKEGALSVTRLRFLKREVPFMKTIEGVLELGMTAQSCAAVSYDWCDTGL